LTPGGAPFYAPMRARIIGGIACTLILVTNVCHAVSVCVNPGGMGGCLASIQQAVDTVVPRGRVDVAAGTYGESVTIPPGAAIQIYGAGAALTIIDGIDGDPVLRVIGDRFTPGGASVAISDVSLIGGAQGVLVSQDRGARVRASISRCAISGNTAAGVDGNGWLRVTESTVSNNGGYGIFVSGRATIDRSTISGNLGDGVYGSGCRSLIRTSTISGNAGTGLVSTDVLNGDLIRTVVRKPPRSPRTA
jgi:hypothetical protein